MPTSIKFLVLAGVFCAALIFNYNLSSWALPEIKAQDIFPNNASSCVFLFWLLSVLVIYVIGYIMGITDEKKS